MDYSAIPRYLESPAHQLFRRCVQCPDTTPSCPQCAANEECTLLPTSCDACSSSKCIKNPSAASASSSTSSPAGPIAGGVIGGIFLVVVIVGLVWYFWLRKRKQQQQQDLQTQLAILKDIDDEPKQRSAHQSFSDARSKRDSARSVFTTRSNVIPIAYIPGVTGTATASPDMVPPVPPIPAAGTTSPHLNNGTEIFFNSNDLRPDSTYARSTRSMGARSSFAASEYQAEINPMPVRQAMAARAVPISVGSNSRVTSPTHSPPLSHQNSIAGRMGRPSVSGQTGQAKQVMITRSTSNLKNGFVHEMEDTSPAPTPRIGIDRSGTASPRSMLSDDAASAHGRNIMGGRSPGSPQQPVSAIRSEFSYASPASNHGWDNHGNNNNSNNIRNTIQNATLLGYNGSQPQHKLSGIAELDGDTASELYGDTHSTISEARSPFADRHAT